MSRIKITGVKRQIKFSPNHIGNDSTIFNMTAQCLSDMGYELEIYPEAEFVLNEVRGKYIFNMVRDKASVRWMQKLEQEGSLVINSGFGIENCTRSRMTEILINNGIPHPDSIIVDTTENAAGRLEEMDAGAFWVKRGDFHAIHQEDVAFARNVSEAKDILKEFAFRGIPNAVINEHLVGDLIKFYGVADTDFFFHFYPFDVSHSKFGLEKINGAAHQYPFDADELKKACDRAGEVLNVKIYGGDCVVAPDGSFKIIDFNDWPSFAPCRDEAASKIAECIDKQIQKTL